MPGILEGLSVVEGSAFVAAPLGGMTLAQLGADVIRFDAIGGGLDYGRWPLAENGASLFWHGMNKGKRSIQVDIHKPEGQEIIGALIASKGTFLSNFPARGWLSDPALRARRDDLVYVNITGDRRGGSAVDYTVNCAVGFADVTGEPGNPNPTNALLPAWDNITGQMAAVALLAADRQRLQGGEGHFAQIALKDVAMATAGHLGNIAEATLSGQDRVRVGNYLYGAFGRDFVTADGRRLMLVGLTGRQWRGIVKAAGIEAEIDELVASEGNDLSREGDRFAARKGIAAILEPWFAARSLAEAGAALDAEGVCWGPYQTFSQMLDEDPDCRQDSPLFRKLVQPDIGEYLVPGSPIVFATTANLEPMVAPTLGAHTDAVLADDLGLSAAEIGRLHDDKTVA
jgi:2-methylfumaryl-CoA isomerase